MVAAAVAWIRAKRPTLTADQVAQAVRLSATDLGPAGWDVDTGFGILSVGRAETITPPPPDPAEPNDDIDLGRRARVRQARPRCSTAATATARLLGLLDVFEDPADVYRVRLRPRSRVKVSANPANRGDVALYGYAAQGEEAQLTAARALGAPRQAHRADRPAQPRRASRARSTWR